MNAWREWFERNFPLENALAALSTRAARATASLLTSGRYDGVRLVGCRGTPSAHSAQVMFVEVDVPIGQRRPVNDIRQTEPVALWFGWDESVPQAYPLRGDFPERVPHLNISFAGCPRSLCLYDMPSDEVLRIATPHALMERIRWWLAETAHGRLHGADQPLDPVFHSAGETLILPWSGLAGLDGRDVLVLQGEDAPGSPLRLVPTPENGLGSEPAKSLFSSMMLTTPPVANREVNMPPRTLRDLVETFANLDVDLVGSLRSAFRRWLASPKAAQLLDKPWLLILNIPIERSPGAIDAFAVQAFQTDGVAARKVAEALGVVWTDGHAVYQAIPDVPLDDQAGRDVELKTLDVHHAIDRRLARLASGRTDHVGDDASIALIGAGAIGSQFALTAARMGIGRWAVVDPDFLLPHNVARHALLAGHVGKPKATALAEEVESILGPDSATGLVAAVTAREAAPLVMSADLVIDGSASVPAARWLARTSGHAARTASIFFNPAGTDLVVLFEGEARSPRLDHVEMAYYWLLVTEGLDDHLAVASGGIRPSGGCRSPSLQIPQSRVGTLASFAVDRVFRDRPESGSVEVWNLSETGLSCRKAKAPHYREFDLGRFTVALSAEVVERMTAIRITSGSEEIGGILVGSWDRQRDVLYVVAVIDAPQDSQSSPTGFIRGSVGVYEALDLVELRTATNLTYVGEWHSHPPGYPTTPSPDDKILLKWIGKALEFSNVPPCMLIVGDDQIRIVLGHHANNVVYKLTQDAHQSVGGASTA